MARARSYSHSLTKMLIIAAASGLDAPRSLARRGILAQSLLFVPGVANAGIADQLEAASRASEITYSQNGKTNAEINQCVRPAWRYYLLIWPPRRSVRVLGVLARGALGLLTQTFDFRTGKNFARMAAGDNSMGSKKNTSLEPRAMKRRATMGCKSGKVLAQARFADEKSCTVAVLDGPGVQRVVDALDALGDECSVDATHVCL